MSSIGENSIKTWLKPFHICSQGEQYRAACARLLQESREEPDKIIIMDEFTSVLDRTNARCMSRAVSKCIRDYNAGNRKCSQWILASANADIINYLQPDLVIRLGGNDDMELIENPHTTNAALTTKDTKSLFDVKVILDLPQFAIKKEDNVLSEDEEKSIYHVHDFGMDVKKTYSVNDHVRELKCNVVMDDHAKDTAKILDVEYFNGETITHIPCLQEKHFNGQFNIGVIVGPSGSGKTTSGERLFGKPKAIKWDSSRRIISHFGADWEKLFRSINIPLSLGFSYYHFLSEGEKHRMDIARYLDCESSVILIDEFTSYLDRGTAKCVAEGVSKYIYQHNKKNVVFLCCKYDVISHLKPSWIFDVQNKKITHYSPPSCDSMPIVEDAEMQSINDSVHSFINIDWNPPKVRLVLKQCSRAAFSPTFSKYHYMSASINGTAKCWSIWAHFTTFSPLQNDKKKGSDKEELDDDEYNGMSVDVDNDGYYDENELELVGFISVLKHFGSRKIRMGHAGNMNFHFREHRTVILPSYQGLGFGSRSADAIAEYLALHNLRLHSKTAHPRYGGYRNKKPSMWMSTPTDGEITARKEWKNNLLRCLYGNQLGDVGLAKRYYVHVYKLHQDRERTEKDEDFLKKRVIVTDAHKNYPDLSF